MISRRSWEKRSTGSLSAVLWRSRGNDQEYHLSFMGNTHIHTLHTSRRMKVCITMTSDSQSCVAFTCHTNACELPRRQKRHDFQAISIWIPFIKVYCTFLFLLFSFPSPSLSYTRGLVYFCLPFILPPQPPIPLVFSSGQLSVDTFSSIDPF
jgi:hypothetical protein